jgi:hypothetical protein
MSGVDYKSSLRTFCDGSSTIRDLSFAMTYAETFSNVQGVRSVRCEEQFIALVATLMKYGGIATLSVAQLHVSQKESWPLSSTTLFASA